MSGSVTAVSDSVLYDSPSAALSAAAPRRSHSPSRSSSVSSTSSSLTFSKEEDISQPKRTSVLAAQLRASLSRREKSVSRSTSSRERGHWSGPHHPGDYEDDDPREAHDAAAVIEDSAAVVSVHAGRLPFECRVFVHKTVCGFIATARQRQHARSIGSAGSSSSSASSPSSDSPSLSPSQSSSLSLSGDSSSLPSVTFHVNESCTLQRLSCELIASCLARASSVAGAPTVDVLALSKSFRLVAATASGRVDEDCPALSAQQPVHHFNLSHFLFVLAHPDTPVPWSLWSLPSDDLFIGPRVRPSSLPGLLVRACAEGDVDRARALLDEAVSADSANEEGATGLHLAAAAGHVAVLHLLCKRGIDVDRRDGRGRTALMWAVQRGQVDCVEALLMWTASAWAEDERGRSALQAARDGGQRELVEVMEEFVRDDGRQTDAVDPDPTDLDDRSHRRPH